MIQHQNQNQNNNMLLKLNIVCHLIKGATIMPVDFSLSNTHFIVLLRRLSNNLSFSEPNRVKIIMPTSHDCSINLHREITSEVILTSSHYDNKGVIVNLKGEAITVDTNCEVLIGFGNAVKTSEIKTNVIYFFGDATHAPDLYKSLDDRKTLIQLF